MEECAIDMPHSSGRQNEKEKVADAGDTSRQSSSEICQATSLNSGTSHGGQNPSPGAPFGRNDYRARCVPLLQAAIKGDWPAAKAFLDHQEREDPDCVRAPITTEEETALHAAVTAQHTSFIKELLKSLRSDDLELKNNYGFTALHSAAQSGIVSIAEQLVKVNKKPLVIPDGREDVPLNVAAYVGHAKMVKYLFHVTPLEQLTPANRTEIFHYTIYNELYDIGLKILEIYPHMATADPKCWRKALKILARKPFAIGSESQLSFWKSLLKYSCFKGIYNKALMKTLAHKLVEDLWKMDDISDKQLSSNLVHFHITLLFEAAKVGNVEFLIILARSYPDLLWQQDENKMSIFHIAIKNRHENVFNLIFEIGANKESLASYATLDTKDNMLHLAGELAPSHRLNIVSGAALQMQRELLWFKEIEKIVPWTSVIDKNSEKKTPKETFTDAHKDLQKEGEKWMKDTANYCMLVATLITTVIFAATFTVPGGSDQVTGIPIRLKSKGLMVYFISIAIALCSSSTSIVIFLSILISSYTEDDFLKSLPLKLVLGLSTLFISMAGMMVAFCATCFLVYTSKKAWVIILVSIPITLFALLHCKIWVDALRSICNSRFIFRQYKYRLF